LLAVPQNRHPFTAQVLFFDCPRKTGDIHIPSITAPLYSTQPLSFAWAVFSYADVFTVHRIDRDTSGLVVFAKDGETHRLFSGVFEGRRVEKRYIAVVHGRPSWKGTNGV
jgi:23S rRNA-/tRNA-specific pseudouridylate synthase